MEISVVIPTCNRKTRLLALLQNLDRLSYPPVEVIVVDSGNEKLAPEEYLGLKHLRIQYIPEAKSVCIQRNTGIRIARSPWIFLCDDDIELPADYLEKLIDHTRSQPEAGAVSGLWMEKEDNEWKSTHPVRSPRELLWKYIFKLGLWGEIECNKGWITRRIKRYFEQKGNHLSKAGWPVNTDFSGSFVVCPVSSLGASLVKKQWLLASPFDETLDRYGIGDNYGVSVGFPTPGVHVVTGTHVLHHKEPSNRLQRSLQYYRRVLALDYFIRIKRNLPGVKRRWLAWSLIGNLFSFILAGDRSLIRAGSKSVWQVLFGRNAYSEASKKGEKVIEPNL